MKPVLFRYDAEIVTTLSIMYDDCRRPRLGFLCGGSVTKNSKKTTCPPCLGEALRRRSFAERTIIMFWV